MITTALSDECMSDEERQAKRLSALSDEEERLLEEVGMVWDASRRTRNP